MDWKCKWFAICSRRSAGFWLVVLLGLVGTVGARAETGRKRIVTTIRPIYSFAASVAGDLAEVENLLPAGVGPHDFQFSPQDMRKLGRADVVIVNGLGLESWLDRALKNSRAGRPVQVVEVTRGLDPKILLSGYECAAHDHGAEGHGHHGESVNPHVWLDPRLAMHAVSNIVAALQGLDPGHAAGYAANGAAYLAVLGRLDQDLARQLEGLRAVPFVTHHDAFPYFIRRYGLNQAGVVELVPDVEPTPQHLKSLYQKVRTSGARAVFTEPRSPTRLVRQMARDLQLKVGVLDPLESGPLAPGSYEQGMRANLKALQEHLK